LVTEYRERSLPGLNKAMVEFSDGRSTLPFLCSSRMVLVGYRQTLTIRRRGFGDTFQLIHVSCPDAKLGFAKPLPTTVYNDVEFGLYSERVTRKKKK